MKPADGEPAFHVLLGPDHAGKSSALALLSQDAQPWHLVSVDDDFLAAEHELLGRLRRELVGEVVPRLGRGYSPDFMVTLLQTAVVHLRDQIAEAPADRPILVDSYYYKIIAKCRLAGVADSPLYAWWRSFPQPRGVVYLDVPPSTAWHRTGRGAGANGLEHYGARPEQAAFEAYQSDLVKLMWEEIRQLPVTVIDEQPDPEHTARAIREALAHELV